MLHDEIRAFPPGTIAFAKTIPRPRRERSLRRAIAPWPLLDEQYSPLEIAPTPAEERK